MFLSTFFAATVAGAALLSGCSDVTNQGGDTECQEFTSAEEQKQDEAIQKMLKDQKGTDPTNLEITATKVSVQAYCRTAGKPDSKISEAPRA
nr:hypothetical protein [Mycolicibacterium palauense]